MLEVEIKAYCPDQKRVADELGRMGAAPNGFRVEEDIYFNHPGRDFAVSDEALRIRKAGGKNYITYKGPKLSKRTKTREEVELKFDDFNSMVKILESLGFNESGRVKKERSFYIFQGINICIDNVEGLGWFVELELQSEDREEAETLLFDLAEKIGLEMFETKSYLEMTLAGEK